MSLNVDEIVNNAVNMPVTVGGDTPWTDKAIGAAISLGSAFGSLFLQKEEIKNAYRMADINQRVYGSNGTNYTGATPWLGITGPAPGGAMPPGYIGGINPMVLLAGVAVLGIGAVILLRK